MPMVYENAPMIAPPLVTVNPLTLPLVTSSTPLLTFFGIFQGARVVFHTWAGR